MSWYLVIFAFSAAVMPVTAQQYVAHYNCNSGGLYFVSDSRWIGTNSTGAEARCFTAGATIVTMSDITGTCAQSYIAHITTQQKRSVSVWVSDGSGGVTCYPMVTTCPASDVVMCKNTRLDAVAPPSTHCGTALSPVANGTIIYPSGDVFPSQAFLVCDLGYAKSSANWYADCGAGGTWGPPSGPQTCNANNCPAPTITNGVVTGSAPVFNVACNAGYEIVGNPTMTCTSAVTTTTLPTCESIVCKTLPTINNGIATAKSMTSYGVLQVHCNPGYVLSGMATSKCLSTGSWETPIASCDEVTCTSPTTAPANGAVTGGTNTFSSVRQYSCNEGYQLSGTSYTICKADGSWSTANPMCTQITCTSPTTAPANGAVTGGTSTFSSVRQYSCMEGYQLSGTSYTICQADRSWSTANPMCTQITCPSPPAALVNGAVTGGTNTFSSVRQYSCNEGYQLSGTSYTICRANGAWSTANPMCTQIRCSAPIPPVTSGSVLSGGTTYLTVRSFICQRNYELSGSRYTVCQADGTWSPATPICTENVCRTLPAPSNGYVYMDDSIFGSKASFSCYAGYQLTGVSSVTCLTNQTWSANSPTCTKITCPVLATPPSAIVSPGTVDFQAKRTFSCSDGYALSGDSQLVCLLSGFWSAPLPTCSKLAECAPLNVGNATVSSGPYRVNTIINITCNAGFELSGNAMVICLDSQKWSSIPICNRVPECPVLAVSDATVSSGSNIVNSIRSVSCNAGFELSGNSMVICMASKSWSTLPVCNRVPECPLLFVNNAVVSGGSTRVNSIRNVTCNVGFELSGNSLATCLPSEKWTTLPVCNRVPECPLLIVSNGIVSGGSNTVNSIRSITCNANFDLSGNSMVICLATAAWSSTPVCNRVAECPTLTVSNAVLAGSSNTVTSVRNITCNAGFELSGNSMVTCLPGAVWSSTPSCNRVVQCGSLQVTNGKVSPGQDTTGSVRMVTCDSGYDLEDDRTAVCLANGTWSSNPVCTVIATTVPPTVQGATEASSFFSQSSSVALIAVIAVLAVLLILAIVGIIVLRRQSPDRKGEMTVTFNNKGIDGEVATVSETPQLSKMPRSDPSGVSLYATPAKNSPAPQSKQDITYAAVEFGGGTRKNTVVAPNPRTDDTTMYSDVTFKAPTS